MGASSSKKEVKVEKPKITTKDLLPLLNVMQLKTSQAKSKKTHDTLKKKGEIVELLKNNNMDMAMAKMDSILRNDDFIAAYDILIPLIEILKEKCSYLVSNDECPAELRALLDTIIYAARRIEIEEYMRFKEKIQLKYGEAYIMKADNNSDKLVNANLVEKLGVNMYKDEVKKIRLKYLAREKNINIKNSGLIPGGEWEVNNQGMNYTKNPYDSTISMNQPNLPTESFIQKQSAMNNYGNQNQGDGFPRDEGFPMQQNYPNLENKNQGPTNPYNSYSQGSQGQNNQFPSYSQNNQGQNNQFPSYSQDNQNQNNQFPSYSQNNVNQSNSVNNSIPSNSVNKVNPENNNIPPSNTGSSQVNEEKKEDKKDPVFGQTVTGTVPVEGSELPPGWGNPDDVFGNVTVKTQVSNIIMDKKGEEEKDPFGGPTNQTIHSSGMNNSKNVQPDNFFGGATSKTMTVSVANPDNKENPFDNDPFAGETIKEESTMKINDSTKKSGVNPFEKGAKVNDPFGGDTINEEQTIKPNESVKKSGVDPFAPGAKVDDPFGGETL